MRFKVLSGFGELVTMRKFDNSGQMKGDYNYCIAKDGQSMTLEYWFKKTPILTVPTMRVFRYVDNRTAP